MSAGLAVVWQVSFLIRFCWIWSSGVVMNTLKFSWMKRTCDVSKVFSQIESLQVDIKSVLVYNRIHSLRNYTTSNLRLRSAESGKLSVSRDFKWPGNKLAHVFADGSSTASHNRKRTFLKAPPGTSLDIKKYIVHVWLLEECGGFKK